MENEETISKKAIKKYLKKYLNLKKSMARLEDKLALIDEHIRRETTPQLLNDKTNLEARINKLNKCARTRRAQIEELLDQLDDTTEAEVLEMIFIYGLDMYDIAERLGYSIRHTYRLYTQAIEHIKLKSQ